MKERNTRLEAELLKVKAENSDLKTRLMEEFTNATAENFELKTRLKQDMQGNYRNCAFATPPPLQSGLIFFLIFVQFWDKLAKS